MGSEQLPSARHWTSALSLLQKSGTPQSSQRMAQDVCARLLPSFFFLCASSRAYGGVHSQQPMVEDAARFRSVDAMLGLSMDYSLEPVVLHTAVANLDRVLHTSHHGMVGTTDVWRCGVVCMCIMRGVDCMESVVSM